MPIFMSDTLCQTWQYLSPSLHNGKNGAWQNIKGEFKTATKETYKSGIEFFHADDFEQIKSDVAARALLDKTMANWLDHGVITPNGDFYGVLKGKHAQFEESLELMAEHLPDTLARQITAKDVYGTWLHVSRLDEPRGLPADLTEAQITTLEKTGFYTNGQIAFDKKLEEDVFPKGNPAFIALVDACFEVRAAGDRFRKENRAMSSAHALIGIENGFRAPC